MSLLHSSKETAPLPALADERDRFRVGTLQYTKAALVVLFLWLLGGDFCFTLMETVLPVTLKLKLKDLGAANVAMSLIVTTIPSGMNFMINPIVSFKSDRFRSRWGRRIPFLLFATPFIVLFLVLLAFSEDIGRHLHATVLGNWHLSATTSIILVMGVMMVCFQFFNMFISSVYYYLFNDVVPRAFLTRFMALFRLVGFVAGWMFNFFLFGHAVTWLKPILIGAALLYGVSFTLMCWRVKEGEYPPPPPNVNRRVGAIAAIQTYARECFTHPFYVFFFLYSGFWSMGVICLPFQVFFAESLGMSLGHFGKLMSYIAIPTILLTYPVGALADRLHPLRVLFVIGCLLPALYFLMFGLAHGTVTFIVLLAIITPLNGFYHACSGPTAMRLLPKERFGQFGSANAMFVSLFGIGGSLAGGLFLDLLARHRPPGDEDYYRYLFLWVATFQTVGIIFLSLVYRGWLRHGGRTAYVPPSVGADTQSPKIEAAV